MMTESVMWWASRCKCYKPHLHEEDIEVCILPKGHKGSCEFFLKKNIFIRLE